jgi:hypothetical protein
MIETLHFDACWIHMLDKEKANCGFKPAAA